jgi:hypothetical protein
MKKNNVTKLNKLIHQLFAQKDNSYVMMDHVYLKNHNVI